MRNIVGIAILIGFAVLTSFRVPMFHDNLSVWTDARDKAPLKPRPMLNLAAAMINAGELESAQDVLMLGYQVSAERSGWEREHGMDLARANLAVVNLRSGHRDEALTLMHGPGTMVHVICQRYGDCPPDEPR